MIPTAITSATERQLADLAGRSHCRLMTRGATAIYVAFKIIAEQNGCGEVIVPAIGCLSIPQAVALAGHQPVFADVDPVSGCLCPEDVARRATSQTKAILPVHIFGHVVDADRVGKVAGSHGIPIVEDACHAFGGRINGKSVGSWGLCSIASFGGTKILGGCGGGALLFDDVDFHTEIERHLAALDEPPRSQNAELLALSHRNLYHAAVDARRSKAAEADLLTVGHMSAAYKALLVSRNQLSTRAIQAIADSVARLPEITAHRHAVARFYDQMLSNTPCNRVHLDEILRTGAVWRYSFTCPCPDTTQALTGALRRNGVHVSNHYWSLAEIWDGTSGLRGASWFQERVVNLWVDAAATPEYLQRTATVVREWSRNLRASIDSFLPRV